jgi:hypothetical protein
MQKSFLGAHESSPESGHSRAEITKSSDDRTAIVAGEVENKIILFISHLYLGEPFVI